MTTEYIKGLPSPKNFKRIEDAYKYAQDLYSALSRWNFQVPSSSKFKGLSWITPEEKGAKGDGVADDTAAVQAAVDACLAGTSPIPLFVGGKYKLTAPIIIDRLVDTMSEDFYIIGPGKTGGFYTEKNINMFDTSFDCSARPRSERIIFEDVSFEGYDPGGTGLGGSAGAHVLNGNAFLRTKFKSCNFYEIRLLKADLHWIQDVYIEHCTIKWLWGNFFDCIEAYDIQFIGNLIEIVTGNVFKCVNPNIATATYAGSNGFRFISNLVEACGSYPHFSSPIVTDCLSGASIAGNYFEADEGPQLDLCVCGDSRFSNKGVSVTGNFFLLTSLTPSYPTWVNQAWDPDYYAIKWGPTDGAFSGGNYCNGRLHDKTDASGLVSDGDWSRVPPASDNTVIPERVVTFDNIGEELVTNGGFDSDVSGWTPIRSTIASVAGGYSGNCLEITADGVPNNAAYQDFDVMRGQPFSLSCYFKSGSSGDGDYWVTVFESTLTTIIGQLTGSTTGAWVQNSSTFTNPVDNTSIRVYVCKQNTDMGTMLFDDVSIKQLPPAIVENGYTQFSMNYDGADGHAVPQFKTEEGDIIKLYKQVDADFGNSPATGDPDTDDLITKIVAALNNLGLIASS